MSDEKKNSTGLIIAAAVLLLLAIAGYLLSSGKPTEPPMSAEQAVVQEPAPSATATQEPIVTGEVPPQPETPQNDVVVDTKKLDLPKAETQATEIAPVASSKEVDAMMGKRSIGNPNAPIKVTEYSSLTCGHCAVFQKDVLPQFKAKYIDSGMVELTFKEFPLNPPALDASQILRCLPAERYESFTTLLFEQQENWAYKPDYRDALRQNAKLAGMSDEQFDACLANEDLKNRIVADMKTASEAYKIQSTPSFVINEGKKVLMGNQPLDMFDKAFAEIAPQPPVSSGQ